MLLYGCVMLGLTFAIAVAHHVAMAAESPRFATLASSFQQLFAMGARVMQAAFWHARRVHRPSSLLLRAGFAQEFAIFDDAAPRPVVTLYFLVWALVSLMLLNLFIGCVRWGVGGEDWARVSRRRLPHPCPPSAAACSLQRRDGRVPEQGHPAVRGAVGGAHDAAHGGRGGRQVGGTHAPRNAPAAAAAAAAGRGQRRLGSGAFPPFGGRFRQQQQQYPQQRRAHRRRSPPQRSGNRARRGRVGCPVSAADPGGTGAAAAWRRRRGRRRVGRSVGLNGCFCSSWQRHYGDILAGSATAAPIAPL